MGGPNIKDINWDTILSLMMLMIFVALISDMNILNYFSHFITTKAQNSRTIILMLVLFDYFASMFFTNDVLILALIPLFINIANRHHLQKAYPLVLLTIAANLGSSITPIGNPQNIFLVSNYHVGMLAFFKHSYIFFIVGLCTVLLLSFLVENKSILNSEKGHRDAIHLKAFNVLIAILLMIVVLMGIFNIINIIIALFVVLCTAILLNYRVIYNVDYGLLLSFIGFFLIVGIFSRSVIINSFISGLATNQRSVFILSALTSQIISNVPASVLIAKFSTYMPAIYYGVSVGGLGTMVASLANLLALKQVTIYSKKDAKKFIVLFSFLNFLLLFLFIIIFYSII
ncbi:carboxylate transporter [Apilactobacillus sp. M161]|uniref:Carboxylate transporter n=1 Tax=Apilactobacillus xinyiensis TaxID=2841032 RepID=A0ABT0HZC3_9LACO|nr:carboxylate transporter [Apilactobacillus xinyiensis]